MDETDTDFFYKTVEKQTHIEAVFKFRYTRTVESGSGSELANRSLRILDPLRIDSDPQHCWIHNNVFLSTFQMIFYLLSKCFSMHTFQMF